MDVHQGIGKVWWTLTSSALKVNYSCKIYTFTKRSNRTGTFIDDSWLFNQHFYTQLLHFECSTPTYTSTTVAVNRANNVQPQMWLATYNISSPETLTHMQNEVCLLNTKVQTCSFSLSGCRSCKSDMSRCYEISVHYLLVGWYCL